MEKQLVIISAFFFFVLELSAQHTGAAKKFPIAFEPVTEVSKIFEEQELREKMKKDGLTEAVIAKLIEGRKKLEAQGRNVEWTSYSKSGGNPSPTANCTDMGVETGWGTWLAATGSNTGGNPGVFGPPATPVAPRFNLTSGTGVDPCTPGTKPGDPAIPVVASGFGTASIQLGQTQNASSAVEQLTYQLAVTVQDTDFVYSYALVFYDWGSSHALDQSPFAEFMILEPNGDTVPCSYKYFTHVAGDSSFYKSNGSCSGGTNTWYKPWTTSGVNLVAYVGQTLTIVIRNGDCVLGGHYAYSYWDFSCGFNDINFCTGQPQTICAPASDPGNPYTYQWYQNGTILPATSQCLTISPQQSDTLSVYVSMASGCDYYVNYILQDSCLSGIEENSSMQGVNIYPSPASRNIFLDFSEKDLGTANISISNILGEELFSGSLPDSGKHMLDISGFSEGIYFVRIKTDSGIVKKKIVISR